ncbi:EAL domain-containing protein [Roseateles sp. BYS87W]|uniref:EAL domain-containing protein n=1 Tax=Pelomonas baiyunensis TaxID=3299026 RepID=A0ABW7GUZ2_9BURK
MSTAPPSAPNTAQSAAQSATQNGATGPSPWDVTPPRLTPWLATPGLLALTYAAAGLVWVLLSDQVLRAFSPDAATLATLDEIKDIGFVLITGALIYALAKRLHQRAVPAMPHAVPAATGLTHPSPAALMWVFAALCGVIVAASLVGYSHSARHAYEHRAAELRQDAELKAGIVHGWMQRRGEEARQLAQDASLRAGVARWHRRSDETVTEALRGQLQMLRASGRFSEVLLADAQAQVLLSADDDTPTAPLSPELQTQVRRAFDTGQVVLSDFIARGATTDGLAFEQAIPLRGGLERPEAVLVLRSALGRTLLPALLAGATADSPTPLLLHPSADPSANSSAAPPVALRVDGHQPAASPTDTPWPEALRQLPQHPEWLGTVQPGLPHGGEPTVAVAAAVPGSSWFVAVQAPERELMADDVAASAGGLLAVNVAAVLAAAAVVYAALQRREAVVAARMAAEQAEKQRGWQIAEAIANSSGDLIFAKDMQGRYLFANDELCRVLGRSRDVLVGAPFQGLFPADQVRQMLEDDAAVLRADRPIRIETRLSTAQGPRVFASTKGKLIDAQGQVMGVFGVSSDITDRRDLQQRLRQWTTAFDDLRDGVIVTDATGRIQSVNRAFTQITGYDVAEAVGSTMRLLHSGRHGKPFYEQMWRVIQQTGHWQGEVWNRRKNGDVYPEWLSIRAVADDGGPATHYVGVFTDVSRLKDSEAQAEWLFHHDPLTRLPNRVQLQRHLEHTLSRARRRQTRPAVLVLDLDGFKTVNDSLGHPAGDELLMCIAERLQTRLRHRDFLGRLGADEFLVILEHGADEATTSALAKELLTAVAEPVALSCGHDAYLTASIGISLFPAEGSPTAVELLRDADAAMHRAKELGRNRSCFYSGDMQTTALTKLAVEAALSRAIERRELLLHYQPKVDAASGRVLGAEALLRWQRGEQGLVPPGQFIPLAEQSTLILDIGAWVIDEACRQIRAWMDQGLPLVRLAVNVAARQFAAGDLDTVVADALHRHGVPAAHLEVELTEGMLVTNPEASAAILHRLRALGVKISLDDFGTGYSSLAYLQQFPIDALKIDQSFVRRIGDEPDGAALVDAVIGLAHRLRLRVVAEGVETATQRDYLLQQHCDEMQGYHFGRPAPADALQALIASQGQASAAG